MNNKSNIIPLKILVVDDSDFSRSLIIRLISEAGHTVVGEAADATSALKQVKPKGANLVITDIVMPEISGIELTEKIVQNYDDVSVIVVSSLSQEHIIIDAIGAGASDFIPKPIEKDQLLDSLLKIQEQISKI